MYHFAVCGDEQRELNKTSALLERYRKAHPDCDFEAKSFSSDPALTDKIEGGAFFDLLLLTQLPCHGTAKRQASYQ